MRGAFEVRGKGEGRTTDGKGSPKGGEKGQPDYRQGYLVGDGGCLRGAEYIGSGGTGGRGQT